MKLVLLLICVTGWQMNIGFAAPVEEKADQLNYRLNEDVVPTDYIIDLTPHFDNETGHEPFTFDGSVTITLQATKANVKTITLHKEDLEILDQTLTTKSKYLPSFAWNVRTISIHHNDWDEPTNKYSIVLDEALDQNQLYELKFQFKGKLRTDMKGFYRSSYKEGDEVK